MTVIKPEFAEFFSQQGQDAPGGEGADNTQNIGDGGNADVNKDTPNPTGGDSGDGGSSTDFNNDVSNNAGDTTNTNSDDPADNVNIDDLSQEEEDLDESRILSFFKNKKGKEISSIDDLLKEPEVTTANPYEKISEKAKSFLDFHIETGRDFEDYIELQKDITKIPDIDFAREKVRKDIDPNLTDQEIDAYLERKLGIDLSDIDNLDTSDKIELKGFAKSEREQRIAEQEKYKQPLENKTSSQTQQPLSEDEVELVTGERMKKADYDKLLLNRQNYLNGLKDSADKITESSFSIKVDDNGAEKTLNYNYEFSTEDKQNMVSSAEDLQKLVESKYNSEQGFNHTNLMEDLFWMDKNNREKAISAIIHKALAERTESILAEVGNVKLGANNDLPASKNGQRVVPITKTDGFGVKFDFNKQNS